MNNYWKECIESSLEEAGIEASQEQILQIASDVEIAHRNHSTAMGYDNIPNPMQETIDSLKKELKREKEKINCKECQGKGYTVTNFLNRSSASTCSNCNGNGRV